MDRVSSHEVNRQIKFSSAVADFRHGLFHKINCIEVQKYDNYSLLMIGFYYYSIIFVKNLDYVKSFLENRWGK
jgi:hypothetical protein